MGAVYKARDRKLRRVVALKVIRNDYRRQVERFLREARAQARIDHELVCRVYEVGEAPGHAFIAMQLIAGQPLSTVYPQLTLDERVQLLAGVCDAVHAAHEHGIIHRDLKPGNILVERRGNGSMRPVVMDFGLAHVTDASKPLTQSGAPLGTPGYMPPEQAKGELHAIGRRSDVYSLGAVLYELLTARPPFLGRSVTAILQQILETEPVPPRHHVPEVPIDLDTIVLKCLQKDPAHRYESARALAEDLRRYLDGKRIVGQRISLSLRVLRWVGKRPAVVMPVIGALLLWIMIVGLWLRGQLHARELAARTQLAEQLGQEVRELELLMHQSHSMPLHDVTPQLALFKKRLDAMVIRRDRLPLQRRGLADYALGRGYLALGEYDHALSRLQAAWTGGDSVPAVSQALGQAYGGLYKQRIADIDVSGDADSIRHLRWKLDAELLTPACEYFRPVEQSHEEPSEYLAGLHALYCQQPEEALRLAEAAWRKQPWSSEAPVLAGDALAALGRSARARGQYPAALKYFTRAVARYQAATDYARSDSTIYESTANVWAELIDLRDLRDLRNGPGEPPRAAYERGLQACNNAIRADPVLRRGHECKLRIAKRWGAYLFARGEDVTAVAEAASQSLVLAQRLGTVSATAVAAVGALYRFQADYSLAHGKDPRAALKSAHAYFQQATAASPELAWAWNDWGSADRIAAEWLSRNGAAVDDVLTLMEQAKRKYQHALEVDFDYSEALSNHLELSARLSRISVESGLRASSDPRAGLAQVYEKAAQTQRLKKEHPEPYRMQAEGHLLAASELLRHGGNVAPEIEMGLQALDKWVRHRPSDARDEALRARLLLVCARWLSRNEGPARKTWTRAHAAAVHAVELDPADPDARLAQAEVARYGAELLAAKGSAAERVIKDGLVAAEQAVRRQPWNLFAQAAQASLWLLCAQLAPHQSPYGLEKGRTALTRLLKRNPLLAADYGSLLERR